MPRAQLTKTPHVTTCLQVGAVGGSFAPGSNAFQGWEVALSPAGEFVRLASHDNNYQLLQQVDHVALPTGAPLSLLVQLSPAAMAAASGGESGGGVRLRISVGGKQLIDYTDSHPVWTAGPALGFRSWQQAVTYSHLAVAPSHGPPQQQHRHRYHAHEGFEGAAIDTDEAAPRPKYTNGVLDHVCAPNYAPYPPCTSHGASIRLGFWGLVVCSFAMAHGLSLHVVPCRV
jgi:hypothetical protein